MPDFFIKYYIYSSKLFIIIMLITANILLFCKCSHFEKRAINSNDDYQQVIDKKIFQTGNDNGSEGKTNVEIMDDDEYYKIDDLELKRTPSIKNNRDFNFERDRNYVLIKWLIIARKYKQAEDTIINFASKNPEDRKYKEHFYYLGIINENKGENIKAIQNYSEAIRICPGYSRAWNSLGYLYSNMRQLNRAESSFLKAIDSNPYNPFIHYNTGNFYYNINNYSVAIKYLKCAVKYKPNFGNAYFKLGVIMYDKENYKDAIEYLNRAVQFKVESHLVYYYIGSSYYKIDEKESALKSLEKALALKKDFFEAYVQIGRIYQDYGEYANAIKAYTRAEPYMTGYRDLKIWIAVCHGESGEYDKAINILNIILKAEPGNGEIKKHIHNLNGKKYNKNINRKNDYMTY